MRVFDAAYASGRHLPARIMAAAGEAVLEVLAPTRCAGCERPGALICERCLAALELIDPRQSCCSCGAPFGVLQCTECTGAVLDHGRCLALAGFSGPLPRIIRAYKDGGERRLAPELAELMLACAEHAEHMAPERYGGMLTQADAVVFVPATAAAFRRRGFDHMERIAQSFCLCAGVPLLDALAKHGSSDQRALGRASRQASAQGAYEVVASVQGMRLLLLDDVITTGATISAAAGALVCAGAASVDALALARVW